MSVSKTIAIVGLSEQETAHLRLLLRSGAADLNQPWRLGEETDADLVVVDVDSFAGLMARMRAQGAGLRCAVFSDAKVDNADLVLQRPLQRANLIAVLNEAVAARAPDPQIGANTADFYTRDLGDESATPTATIDFDDAVAVQGLDDVLRPKPVELRNETEPSVTVIGDAGVGGSGNDAGPLSKAPPKKAPPSRNYATRESMLADMAPRELREYLEGDLLRVPARFALPDAPMLTVDPKNKVVHTAGGLATLTPYCLGRWRFCDWQPLTSTELAEVRASQQTHAYARLVWLDVLLDSNGRLAGHLDPGGIYRLKHWVEIEKDFSRYFRIATALLQPIRLHEIAAAASAPMSDVFDVVNAYDAIGLIEWQPRPRRAAPAIKSTGLFGRWRNPFGKH